MVKETYCYCLLLLFLQLFPAWDSLMLKAMEISLMVKAMEMTEWDLLMESFLMMKTRVLKLR